MEQINLMTVKSYVLSGNGNPTLLIIFIYMPFAIWFGNVWVKQYSNLFSRSRVQMIVSILSMVFIFIGIYITILSFQNLRSEIMKYALQRSGTASQINMNFVNGVTKGISIYNNSLYFNGITFFMYICLLNLIAIINNYLKKRHTN